MFPLMQKTLRRAFFFNSNYRMNPLIFFCMMPKYEHITIFSSVLDL